jgi:catechol 2,3-dioxygenase-like lactoylglutathione lyase family enzyme
MIRGIHHIGIHTPDLDRLRSFYEKAFGFQIVGEEFHLEDALEAPLVTGVPGGVARIVLLRAHNCYLELFQWSAPKGRPQQPLNAYDFGYTHLCVDVADIDQEYKRLSELGMTFVHPAPVRFGDLASVYGRDPDGNIIEISEIPKGNILHLDAGPEPR